MEYIDILDGNGIPTGEIKDKDEAHEKGLWHREVGVWVINSKNELLMQRRSPNKKFNPNKWAICAGHVSVGETFIQAALREFEEELGISICEKELQFMFSFKKSDTKSNKTLKNNYFGETYIVKLDKELSEFKMQEEEVSELKYIQVDELKNMINSNNETVFKNDDYMNSFFEKLNDLILDKRQVKV